MRVHIAEPSLFRIEVELMFDYERVDPLLLAVWQNLKRGRAYEKGIVLFLALVGWGNTCMVVVSFFLLDILDTLLFLYIYLHHPFVFNLTIVPPNW